MSVVNGDGGFTQLTKLNVIDSIFVNGNEISASGAALDVSRYTQLTELSVETLLIGGVEVTGGAPGTPSKPTVFQKLNIIDSLTINGFEVEVCQTLFSVAIGNVALIDSGTGVRFDGPFTGSDIGATASTFIPSADAQGVYFNFDIATLSSGDAIAFGYDDGALSTFCFGNFAYDGADFTLTISSSGGSAGPITLSSPLISDEFCVSFSTTANTINVYRNGSLELTASLTGDFSSLTRAFAFSSALAGSGNEAFFLQSPSEIPGITRYCT